MKRMIGKINRVLVNSMPQQLPRLALTVGEPAGIGADIVIGIAEQRLACDINLVVDPNLLDQRAQLLGSSLRCTDAKQQTFGHFNIIQGHTLSALVRAGQLDSANSQYVFNSIQFAAQACLTGEFDAMITAPVHKGIINDAGIQFSGHTELISAQCGVVKPVMMLADSRLRVALVTTHLPLSAVPAAINHDVISTVVEIVHADLQAKFGLKNPSIIICGLNPHAGEGGHIGKEELEIITPCVQQLGDKGINITGPIPADTAFAPHIVKNADVVIAMYHDQGLPVIKAQGFGDIVNITLGLPIIRTSVDHGTALDLAGTGKASANSLLAAIEQAKRMVEVKNGA